MAGQDQRETPRGAETGAHAPTVTAWDPGARSWVTVTLPGGCVAWNGAHDCRRESDHPHDHVCVCGDQWNRGPWDTYEDPDDRDYFEDQRDREYPPDDRCVHALEAPGVTS